MLTKHIYKMRKTILPLFTTAILSIFLIACGEKKEETSTKINQTTKTSSTEEGIDGTWEVTKAEGSFADLNKGVKYVFLENKMSTESGIIKTKGNYKLSGDTIIWILEGTDNLEMRYTYKIENSQMIVKPIGSDQILFMNKK